MVKSVDIAEYIESENQKVVIRAGKWGKWGPRWPKHTKLKLYRMNNGRDINVQYDDYS